MKWCNCKVLCIVKFVLKNFNLFLVYSEKNIFLSNLKIIL